MKVMKASLIFLFSNISNICGKKIKIETIIAYGMHNVPVSKSLNNIINNVLTNTTKNSLNNEVLI